jgi:hypothetical protein
LVRPEGNAARAGAGHTADCDGDGDECGGPGERRAGLGRGL